MQVQLCTISHSNNTMNIENMCRRYRAIEANKGSIAIRIRKS
jgi:hypothetical protein